jgi:uncharacterized damage-inducible protein DinB
MTISEMLLPEFDHEMSSTRTMLERVPDDKFDWKPHQKSMSMGRLASHTAEMADWAHVVTTTDKLELTPDMKPFNAKNRAELLDKFDKSAAEARKAIAGASDEDLAKIWSLIYNGNPVLTMPRSAVLRSMVMNHIIHHRAQLSVYLRLNEIPVPGMYGPSADAEGPLAASAD